MSTRSAAISSYLAKVAFITVQVVIAVFFIRFFVLELGRVEGLSMDPNLQDDTLFIVNRVSLYFKTPQRGDVVQLYHPSRENALIVKRIVGLPGESLAIVNNGITVTDSSGKQTVLEEDYLGEFIVTAARGLARKSIDIPPHHYFVIGDNRENSIDSREYGPIHRNRITGTVVPLN